MDVVRIPPIAPVTNRMNRFDRPQRPWKHAANTDKPGSEPFLHGGGACAGGAFGATFPPAVTNPRHMGALRDRVIRADRGSMRMSM